MNVTDEWTNYHPFRSALPKEIPEAFTKWPEFKGRLNEGLRSKAQWNREILLDEGHKLDPRALDEGPRLESGKSRLNLHGTILDGNSIGSDF